MTRMVFAYDPTPGALTWLAENYPEAKRLATIGTLENGVEALEQLAPQVWPEVSSGGEIVLKEIHDVGLTDQPGHRPRQVEHPRRHLHRLLATTWATWSSSSARRPSRCRLLASSSRKTRRRSPASSTTPTSSPPTTTTPRIRNPWNVEFVEGHQEKYGEDPEYYGANYYEQVFVVWDLMRRVLAEGGDPLSGEALQQALIQNPVFKSVYGGDAENVGEMSFDTEAHTISKPMGVFAVKDGVPELLEPIPAELVPPAERPA